jgi:hypothetical protein
MTGPIPLSPDDKPFGIMRNILSGCAALLTLACCLAPAVAQAPADAVDTTRITLAKWFETQQILSKEKRDWELGKEVLEQRIAMLENEIAGLDGKIAEARQSLGEAAARKSDVAAGHRDLEAATSLMQERIAPLETKTRDLIRTLPAPIRDRIEPLARRIPENPDASHLTLGQRYQSVIGVLNEIDKFNREITVVNELRELPDGRKLEVRALYLGLGQGYYVTPDGESAGLGVAGDGGWTWQPADALAPHIARAIAIFENEQPPAYVPLEVNIR